MDSKDSALIVALIGAFILVWVGVGNWHRETYLNQEIARLTSEKQDLKQEFEAFKAGVVYAK